VVAGEENRSIRTARTDPCRIWFPVYEMCQLANPIILVAFWLHFGYSSRVAVRIG
jgi:hypothetical protein